jgi:hypothetical protein
MPASDLGLEATIVAFFVAAIVIVVLALNLRRALVDRLYRARALWTAIGALAMISLTLAEAVVDPIFGQVPSNLTSLIVEDVVWGFTFLGLFGWIVTNVNVAIDADYFNRDVLAWKSRGKVVAPVLLISLYLVVSLPPWWLPAGTASEMIGSIISLVTGAAFLGVILYAAAALVITYRRVSDMRIKSFTKWVVVSMLSVFLVFTLPNELIVVAPFLWAYSMYRSVGSLAIKVRKLPT